MSVTAQIFDTTDDMILPLMVQKLLFIVWSANIYFYLALVPKKLLNIGVHKALEMCYYLIYGEWILKKETLSGTCFIS